MFLEEENNGACENISHYTDKTIAHIFEEPTVEIIASN